MTAELFLILLPALGSAATAVFKSKRADRVILLLVAFIHLVLSLLLPENKGLFLGLDSLSRIFLITVSVLFAGSALSTSVFAKSEEEGPYNRVYTAAMLFILSSMTGVVLSRNLGLMWVFVEASTLSSAPLIHHPRSRDSLEALWKYLFISSVGIALAFVGVITLIATSHTVTESTLNIDQLIQGASQFSPLWLKISFVFAFVGFSTKMGLAPMHSCHPDAKTFAPTPSSAILSGALMPCAFLAILRYYQIAVHTEVLGFCKILFLVTGLFSIFVAAVYVRRVVNIKRILAYSSIEHMGIMAVGVGLGGVAVYGTLLHIMVHGLAKHLMFLSAGNLIRVYKTGDMNSVSGAMQQAPLSSWLILAGVFALLGSPPFGTFISEFIIIRQMVADELWIVLVLFAILLTVIFYSMVKRVIAITFTNQDTPISTSRKLESMLDILPQVLFLAGLVFLGINIPWHVHSMLKGASLLLGGN